MGLPVAQALAAAPDPVASMSGPMWMPMAPPTFARVAAWHPQPVPALPLIVVILLALYGAGVFALHRRGIRWPVGRSLWWICGCASILAVTATGVDGYGMELFSIHMVQHMVLNMLSPILLVLGRPVTLLLRSLPVGAGGKGRMRRGILWLMHTTFSSFLTHPVVTFALFIMSLYGLYFTPAFDYLMSTWWGHNIMLVHFLAIGFLYFWGVIGVDPTPRSSGRGLRTVSGPVLSVLELAATAPFHAFFGVMVMMSTTLLVHFYSVSPSGWQLSPLADQGTGGGIAWGFTELPTLMVLGALVLKWQQTDRRATRALDRRVAREGDTALDDYNEYLQSLNRRNGTGSLR